MADLNGDRAFRLDAEWAPSDGVVTPEVAATWCRLSIWVRDRCITTVDAADSSFRRSIYASAYPLAEWIAYNWWALASEVRPSAVSSQNWTWSQVSSNEWLRRHNFRGAGAGMPWPDLTIVPEGSVTGIAWKSGPGMLGQPVRFMESGFDHVSSAEVETELRRFVNQVLDQLSEVGIKSLLADEWAAITGADSEEADFARAAARLGLDPYSLSDSVADDIVAISEELEPELFGEFADTADPGQLGTAVQWLTQARELASPSQAIETTLGDLRHGLQVGNDSRPYIRGYGLAQDLRQQLGLASTDRVDLNGLVSKSVLERPAGGLEGYVSADDAVALVLPTEMESGQTRFAQGRSLGLALSGPRSEYLLDPAGTDLVKQSRAFAAELLAPAEGVAVYLSEFPASTDAAFEAIARRFGASTSVVRWQYKNQVAGDNWSE